jgi:hypothetical protein
MIVITVYIVIVFLVCIPLAFETLTDMKTIDVNARNENICKESERVLRSL